MTLFSPSALIVDCDQIRSAGSLLSSVISPHNPSHAGQLSGEQALFGDGGLDAPAAVSSSPSAFLIRVRTLIHFKA
jgi:hypothetical protein